MRFKKMLFILDILMILLLTILIFQGCNSSINSEEGEEKVKFSFPDEIESGAFIKLKGSPNAEITIRYEINGSYMEKTFKFDDKGNCSIQFHPIIRDLDINWEYKGDELKQGESKIKGKKLIEITASAVFLGSENHIIAIYKNYIDIFSPLDPFRLFSQKMENHIYEIKNFYRYNDKNSYIYLLTGDKEYQFIRCDLSGCKYLGNGNLNLKDMKTRLIYDPYRQEFVYSLAGETQPHVLNIDLHDYEYNAQIDYLFPVIALPIGVDNYAMFVSEGNVYIGKNIGEDLDIIKYRRPYGEVIKETTFSTSIINFNQITEFMPYKGKLISLAKDLKGNIRLICIDRKLRNNQIHFKVSQNDAGKSFTPYLAKSESEIYALLSDPAFLRRVDINVERCEFGKSYDNGDLRNFHPDFVTRNGFIGFLSKNSLKIINESLKIEKEIVFDMNVDRASFYNGLMLIKSGDNFYITYDRSLRDSFSESVGSYFEYNFPPYIKKFDCEHDVVSQKLYCEVLYDDGNKDDLGIILKLDLFDKYYEYSPLVIGPSWNEDYFIIDVKNYNYCNSATIVVLDTLGKRSEKVIHTVW